MLVPSQLRSYGHQMVAGGGRISFLKGCSPEWLPMLQYTILSNAQTGRTKGKNSSSWEVKESESRGEIEGMWVRFDQNTLYKDMNSQLNHYKNCSQSRLKTIIMGLGVHTCNPSTFEVKACRQQISSSRASLLLEFEESLN